MGAGKLPISVTGNPVSGEPAATSSDVDQNSGVYIPARRDAGNSRFAGVLTPEEAWASTKPFFDMYRKEYGDTLKKNKGSQQIADLISAITGGAGLLQGASNLTGIKAKDVYKYVADWIKGQGNGSGAGANAGQGSGDSGYQLEDNAFEGVGGIDMQDSSIPQSGSYEDTGGQLDTNLDFGYTGTEDTVVEPDSSYDLGSDFSSDDSGGYSIF